MKKSVVWIESRWFHKTDISASPLSVSCQTRSVFNSTWPYLARDHTRPDISLQIFPLFSVLTVEVNFLLTVEVSPAGSVRWQLYIRGLWRAEDLQQNLLDTCLKKFSSKYQVECFIMYEVLFWKWDCEKGGDDISRYNLWDAAPGKHWQRWWGGPSLPFSQFLFHRCFCPAVLIVLQFPPYLPSFVQMRVVNAETNTKTSISPPCGSNPFTTFLSARSVLARS